MRLSELYAQLKTAGDLHAFSAYLAMPDLDGIDVDLVPVGRVEVDYAKGEARLYPASTSTDIDAVEPEPYFGMVLEQLPLDTTGDGDLRLMVEVPLLRDEAGDAAIRLVELAGLHVGVAAEEVWLLVVPASGFAAGLLPD
jgi:hypothetical protein